MSFSVQVLSISIHQNMNINTERVKKEDVFIFYYQLNSAGFADEVRDAALLTAVCSLSSPDASSGRPGWQPVTPSGCAHASGNGSVRCVPAGTTLGTL